MSFVRVLLALAVLPFLAGCGYVHFGRLPDPATATGDVALVQAYSNLGTEHKILKQELALARKEGDALRAALDRASGGSASPESAARLNEATRELDTLRASYAKLQAERTSTAGMGGAVPSAKFSELEEKLAASLRGFTQLQEENARLRASLDRTRSENLALSEQLKTAVVQKDQAQAELAQLNTELLVEKEARGRAEQITAATRAQLSLVLAQKPGDAGATSSPSNPGSLGLAKSPPADASATAELRTSPDRLRPGGTAGETSPAGTANPSAAGTVPGRVHIVQEGDTLEKIARQYYSVPDRWRTIYQANEDLLSGGRSLQLGMKLAIPEP